MQVRGHRTAGLLLEKDFRSLWVVEVVDHVGLTTCGGGRFSQRTRVLVCPSSAVFVDRQRDLTGCSWWRDRGRRCECLRCRVRAREMRRCKHGWHGDDLVFMRTTQPWAWGNAYKVVNCASTACRSVNSSANNWTETHYQLERNSERKLFHEIRSLCSRTCWRTSNSVSNTVLSLNVLGNWSREFQPLCFPDLDSPDSQSHVLGYSLWTNW